MLIETDVILHKWTVDMKRWTRDWKDVDVLFVNPVVLDIDFLPIALQRKQSWD
jgi:hypothetical protein